MATGGLSHPFDRLCIGARNVPIISGRIDERAGALFYKAVEEHSGCWQAHVFLCVLPMLLLLHIDICKWPSGGDVIRRAATLCGDSVDIKGMIRCHQEG